VEFRKLTRTTCVTGTPDRHRKEKGRDEAQTNEQLTKLGEDLSQENRRHPSKDTEREHPLGHSLTCH
jgi:hypothetical protein